MASSRRLEGARPCPRASSRRQRSLGSPPADRAGGSQWSRAGRPCDSPRHGPRCHRTAQLSRHGQRAPWLFFYIAAHHYRSSSAGVAPGARRRPLSSSTRLYSVLPFNGARHPESQNSTAHPPRRACRRPCRPSESASCSLCYHGSRPSPFCLLLVACPVSANRRAQRRWRELLSSGPESTFLPSLILLSSSLKRPSTPSAQKSKLPVASSELAPAPFHPRPQRPPGCIVRRTPLKAPSGSLREGGAAGARPQASSASSSTTPLQTRTAFRRIPLTTGAASGSSRLSAARRRVDTRGAPSSDISCPRGPLPVLPAWLAGLASRERWPGTWVYRA